MCPDLDAQSKDWLENWALIVVPGNERFRRDLGADAPSLVKVTLYGNRDGVQSLLHRGSQVDESNGTGLTALHAAAFLGHAECAAVLLEHGAKNLPERENGQTPLHFAVKEGHQDVVGLILRAYPDAINCVDSESKRTPLHLAISAEKDKVAEFLIRAKADLNIKDLFSFTPLTLAIFKVCVSLVIRLLKAGAKAEVKSGAGNSLVFQPIHMAAYMGTESVMKLLNKCNVDVNVETTWDALVRASDGMKDYRAGQNIGDIAAAEEDVNFGQRNDLKRRVTPLHLAALRGNRDAVKILLDKGAQMTVSDTSQHGKFSSPHSPLLYAFRYPDVLKMLLKTEAGQDKGLLQDVFFQSAAKGALQTLELLAPLVGIDAKTSNRRLRNMTALHVAIWHRDFAWPEKYRLGTVQKILELGGSTRIADREGKLPLHWAVEMDFKLIVKALLEHDKDTLDIQTNVGQTPLSLACTKGFKDIAIYLLQAGANVWAADSFAWTPLHHTIGSSYKDAVASIKHEEFSFQDMADFKRDDSQRRLGIATALLEKDSALVNAVTQDGRSVLELAVHKDWDEMVKLLIAYGANVSKDVQALSIAVRDVMSVSIAELLLNEGADPNHAIVLNATTSPLAHIAIKNNDLDMVRLLLEFNANVLFVDGDRQTLLHASAATGRVDLVNLVLEQAKEKLKSDKDPINQFVNSQDYNGWTALHCAVNNGHADVVGKLLEEGARPDAEANGNMTAYTLATIGGFTAICIKLGHIKAKEDENVLSLARAKGIPVDSKVPAKQAKQKALEDLAKFQSQCKLLETTSKTKNFSSLAKTYPRFNDEVEFKPWLPESWREDGFLSIPDDLMVLRTRKGCALRHTPTGVTDFGHLMEMADRACYPACVEKEECAKMNAMLLLCGRIEAFLRSPQSGLACLEPRLNVIGSIIEGTRLGGADEMDLPVTFGKIKEHPFTLEDGSSTAHLKAPNKIPFLHQFKNELGGFCYSKFLETFCHEIKTCLENLSSQNCMPKGLSCDIDWKPCQQCNSRCETNRKFLTHCRNCFPVVTYTKLGACLIFKFLDLWGSQRVLTLDLIPCFEINYNGNSTTLSQKVFSSLFDVKPDGWAYHCHQVSKRDRMLIDHQSRSLLFRENPIQNRTEGMSLKLLNDYEEGLIFTIRPFHASASSDKTNKLMRDVTFNKNYIILKALAKVLNIDISSYLIKKHLISFFGQTPLADNAELKPVPLPTLIMALDIRHEFEPFIDLRQWKRDLLNSADQVMSIYIPIKLSTRAPNLIERCYKDYQMTSYLHPRRKIGAAMLRITESRILEAAHYFMTRRPVEVVQAMEVLHKILEDRQGFADSDGVVKLILTVMETFPRNNKLLHKTLNLLQHMFDADMALDYNMISRVLKNLASLKSVSPVICSKIILCVEKMHLIN